MRNKISQKTTGNFSKGISCEIPRKQKAIAALLSLAWKKRRKDRPNWIEEDLKSFLNQ
tara:strand:- start:713 stop:886 length:174 start_codon:yes stop_codon:yes gene_type:complete